MRSFEEPVKIRSDWRPIIFLAATIILSSLLLETRSLNTFWQTLNYTPSRSFNNNENSPSIGKERNILPSLTQQSPKRITIPSNSNSTIASDISEIWHDPENQAICVFLKENARCPHPAFLGRISGQSLALLEWNEEEEEEVDNVGESYSEFVHCGSYKNQWLEAGTYFLEIIILFCDDFGINAMTRKQNESAWLSYDFQKDCIEDPTYNRITGEESYITVNVQEANQQSANHLGNKGRWVSNVTTVSAPEPLHTRYQPKHCRKNPQLERCAVPMNDTALKSYSFEWGDKKNVEAWSTRLKVAARRGKLPKICLIGYSHSRFLTKSFGAIGLGKFVHHVQARYPSDISPWTFDHYYSTHQCTRFIVGVAQWPGSLMQGSPYLFNRFYSEMKRIANDAATTFADKGDKNEVKVYLRSIHHIPIGDVTGTCPITDWRSPVVMDAYTHVIQKAVEEVQMGNVSGSSKHVEFLDTRFIASPMWDSAYDWVHLPPQVSDVEALYMASIIYDKLLSDPSIGATTENGRGEGV
ncbi:MAG: hypothetical protein SGBAC_012738 [Bacillariaceae sp.]